MKTISLIFVLLAVFCLIAWAAPPDKPTLTLRFQPPETADASASDCRLDQVEVEKACKLLRSKLRQSGMEVQLGTFQRGEGGGQLWIDGKPLETWLAGAKPCRVTALQIVEAGLAAAEKMQNHRDEARRSASGSAASPSPATAPIR